MIYHKISSMFSQFTPTSFDQALYQETSLLPRRGKAGLAAFSRFGSARPVFVFLLLLYGASTCLAQRCGGQAVCADNLCCSQYGYCGSTSNYCGTGCQSGPCTGSGSGSGSCSPSPFDQYCSQYDYYCSQYLSSTNSTSAPTPISANNSISIAAAISSIITSDLFDQFLSRRNSAPANGFYTYDAFLAAAAAYAGFGTTGRSSDVQKRELAAFFANIAHETGSGQYVGEINKDTYCDTSSSIPCASGQQYYGCGPIQLTWNYNYKAAGDAIGFNGIKNPGIVASDPEISFKTVVWYWMTQASPTCHDAIVNNNGFSATINAINGALECGSNPSNPGGQRNRIQLYESFCDTLGVDPGSNLSC